MHNDPSGFTASRRHLLVLGAAAVLHMPARAAVFREISWDELVPKGWDPMKSFKDMSPMATDTDPRTAAMYARLRDIWDKAPTVASLAGQSVKLPGYLVPLDEAKDGIREFLLVPYFGACIHTPPPPANQIVHVQSQEPIKGLRTMSAIWVSGTLGIERLPSTMGVSAYTMAASRVEAYSGK